MQNRIVRVFPGTDKEFMATVIFEDEKIVKVMTPSEEVFTVGKESVVNATTEEIFSQMDSITERVTGIVREGVRKAYVDGDKRPVETEEDDEWYSTWPGPGEIAVTWDGREDIPF